MSVPAGAHVRVLTPEERFARKFCYDNGCSPLNDAMLLKFEEAFTQEFRRDSVVGEDNA